MAERQGEAAAAAAAAAASAARRPDTFKEWEAEEADDDMEWEDGDDGGLGEEEEEEEEEEGAGQADEDGEEGEDEEDEDLLRFLQGAEAKGGGLVVELEERGKGDEAEGAGKGASKAGARTAKELRRDFRIHTAHLAVLLHRARLISRYADDADVQAVALSLVPAHLATVIGEHRDHSLPTVTRLAKWFQESFRALPDADVDESEGKEGSPPARMMRVLEQRAGSGHELVQAFLATCRALGLPTRYVCPLDPRSYRDPPYLRLRKKAVRDGQGRMMVDLTQAEEEEGEEGEEDDGKKGKGKGKGGKGKKRRKQLRGTKALLSARYGLKPLNGSWVWCEVRCTPELPSSSSSSSLPPKAAAAASTASRKKKQKKGQTDSSPSPSFSPPVIDVPSSSSSDDDDGGGPGKGSKGKGKKRARPRVQRNGEGGGNGAVAGRWTQVDVLRRLVDRPNMVETLQPGGQRRLLLYVVGVEGKGQKQRQQQQQQQPGGGDGGPGGDGLVTDVTRRYAAARWSRVVKDRAASWWEQHLKRVNRRARRRHQQRLLDGDFRAYYAVEAARKAEERELKEMAEAQPMPTSLEGFKRHPKFVLDRHLGRWDVVYPPKVVGLFKGEAVYERQNVHEGATALQWRRNGRVVREGEKPARVVTGKGKGGKGAKQQRAASPSPSAAAAAAGSSAAAAAAAAAPSKQEEEEVASLASRGTEEGGGGGEQRSVELFGFWQTEKYAPPPLLPGDKLPLNEYGNIEVLGGNRAFLPRGTVHRTERGLWQVAKRLGIQYAPALTGFEVKNGRSVPVLEGVVVLQRDEAALLDAYGAFAAQKEEKAAKAREKKILDRWVRLLKGLRIQQRLKGGGVDGGNGGGNGAAAAGPVAKKGKTAATAGARAGGTVGKRGKGKRVVEEEEEEEEEEDGEATESESEG